MVGCIIATGKRINILVLASIVITSISPLVIVGSDSIFFWNQILIPCNVIYAISNVIRFCFKQAPVFKVKTQLNTLKLILSEILLGTSWSHQNGRIWQFHNFELRRTHTLQPKTFSATCAQHAAILRRHMFLSTCTKFQITPQSMLWKMQTENLENANLKSR